MLSDEGRLLPFEILPAQYLELAAWGRELRGEHQLVLAILEDAIHIYRTANRRRRLFREAAAWIESTESSWIFSFERICEVLEFDPEYIRRGVRASRWRVQLASLPHRAPAPDAATHA